MLLFLIIALVTEALATSIAIDGCAVSVISVEKEYCIHCSDANKLPIPDGSACALNCKTNEGIKNCIKCGKNKCSRCSAQLVPTSDGLKCVPKCNDKRQTGIENCQTCTAPLAPLQCTACNQPYTLSADKKSCVLLCNNALIDNCQKCNDGADTCKECESGYIPSADGKFCYRTCGTGGPIQYCTGCKEQTCMTCNSMSYLEGNKCVLRKGLEESCFTDDQCHASLKCLFSGTGFNTGERKCFPSNCAPSISDSGLQAVCNGQGRCISTHSTLDSQSFEGSCYCLSAELSSTDRCGSCVNPNLMPSYDIVGTCVSKQGPYESCSKTLTCQAGLTCYQNYQCIPTDCLSGLLPLTKVVCDKAGSCSEATFDSSTGKWKAKCICFDANRTTDSKCQQCLNGGRPVGITCANANCVDKVGSKNIVCSGHGYCQSDGSGCVCNEGFTPVTVDKGKHRCYPSTCGGTPSDSKTYCKNGLGTCMQQLDDTYLCACPAGYRGVETHAGMTNNFDGCVPWSCFPMLNGSICGPFNGGTCNAITKGGHECTCNQGFILTEKGCIPNKCGPQANGTVCRAKGLCEKGSSQSWTCNCLDGYKVTDKGCFNNRCKATSEGIPCNGHGECLNNIRCKCSAGYAGPACSIKTVVLAVAITVPILVLLVAGILMYVFVKRAIAKREQAKLMKGMFPVVTKKKK